MIDAGASAVGGCCGTDPDFISAIRRRLDKRVG
jgi:S-methylmethionine-dependent homocysteine/selenocysteine methylase